MPTLTDALSFIATCDDPDELCRVSTAVNDQIKGLRAVERATVTEKRRTKVVVDFDVPHRRFHKGVICPPEMLELG